MKLFEKKPAASVAFGTAMMALVGAETVSAEQATAANQELEAAGVRGAQLITEGAFSDLTAKADRVDAAEASVSGFTQALTAAGAADMAALVASRDEWKGKAEAYGAQPGTMGTTPPKTGTDAGEEGADEHQQAIDNLPHNKALEGHPMWG